MINNCTFIGRISTELELSQTENGESFCNFQLAVSRTKETTDFPPMVVYGKLAETMCTYLSKGDLVGIRSSYRSRISNGKKYYQFVVKEIQFLQNNNSLESLDDIDIPFQNNFNADNSVGGDSSL